MAHKKKASRAGTLAAAIPASKPQLPLPALILRVGLILLAAAVAQTFLPRP